MPDCTNPAVQKQASVAATPVHWKLGEPVHVLALPKAVEPVGQAAHERPVSTPGHAFEKV